MTLGNLISAQANKNPGKIAVKHGDTVLTYAQLNTKAAQLARYFQAQGLQANDVVALAVDRTPEMIIAFLAFVKAGITYLPIDNALPINRITHMLTDAGVVLFVTSRKYAEKYREHKYGVSIEYAIEQAEKYFSGDLEAAVDPSGIAYILYTSGSTGLPKGVLVKRSGLLNLLLSIQQKPGITPDDVMLFTSTVSFDIAELEIFLPLISGATLVVADTETVKDGRALIEIARREKVTIMQGTPYMWRTMLEAGWIEQLPIKVFCGGEAMSRELAEGLASRCNELWNMYGPTETTIYSLIGQIMPDEKIITIGKPIRETLVYLLNEQLKPVPEGETGEIYIGGAGLAAGYLNLPHLTNEKFIDDPFARLAGEKMYKTGDLGKLVPDGDILCLGRIDHQIKIRGFRIEAGEIEYQLKQHHEIANALVVPYTDQADNMHLVAYVVPFNMLRENERVEQINAWEEHLANLLPAYMIPDIFMPVREIPVMPNGKIDRNALPTPIIHTQGTEPYAKPKTETEITLTRIFLKNIAVKRIGINNNIFRLGIDSLIMVKVMVQIEKELGRRYPLSAFIKYPTIKELALMIENNVTDSEYRSLIPIRPKGSRPPLYIVHGMGLNLLNMYHMISLLHEDQPVYGLQAVGLDGTIEPMDNMEEIARFYNNEILTHDPIGPYLIAGYSFGGYIGFEMVRQLQEMGKEVKMLAMLDTNLQIPTHQMELRDKLKIKFARQFKKVSLRISTFNKWPLKTVHYLLLQIPVYFYNLLKLMGIKTWHNTEGAPEYMHHIMQRLEKALDDHTFKPLNVQIQLFKAEVKLYYVDDPKYLGWKELAKGGVQVHIVPGDHREMLISPNDKVLADALQKQLDMVIPLTP